MSQYSRKEVIGAFAKWEKIEVPAAETIIKTIETAIIQHFIGDANDYAVVRFDNLPEIFRSVFSFNGGDEDWFVACRKEDEYGIPMWIERMDSMHEPDEYKMNGCIVYIGSHA